MLDAHGRPKSPDQQGTGNEEKENADEDAQSSHENIINLSGISLTTESTENTEKNKRAIFISFAR
jgi:hypothetical protein